MLQSNESFFLQSQTVYSCPKCNSVENLKQVSMRPSSPVDTLSSMGSKATLTLFQPKRASACSGSQKIFSHIFFPFLIAKRGNGVDKIS